MKKLLESKIMLVVITMIVSITGSVIANTIISSNAISYSNDKTAETTVNGALNELFNSVDINDRLGSTDISSIGNGTITGAISAQNTALTSSIKRSDYFKKLNTNGNAVGGYINAVNISRPVLIYDTANTMNYWFGFYGFVPNGTYTLTKIASYNLEAIANNVGTISVTGGSGNYDYYNIIPSTIGLN